MVQIGKNEGEKKAKFASVPPGKSIETITLQEALAAFEGPRVVGEYNGEKVTAATGKFGPYVKFGKTYVSIRKDSGFDYGTITLEEAIPLIDAKLELEKNKFINSFEYNKKTIEILRGMYGPYIKYGGYNFRLPKGGKDATDLTLEDCIPIVDKNAKGAKGSVETKHAASKDKKAAKKAPAKKSKK